MPWDGVISDQDETPPDSPRAFLRANSRRASPGLKSQQLRPVEVLATGKAGPVGGGKAASSVTPVVENPLGAKWLDDFSKKVNSTQWIEPGQHQAKRAGQQNFFLSRTCLGLASFAFESQYRRTRLHHAAGLPDTASITVRPYRLPRLAL